MQSVLIGRALELIFVGTFDHCHSVTHHNVWETTGNYPEEGNSVTKSQGGEEYPTNNKTKEVAVLFQLMHIYTL
jgi:hypothetical protein